MARPSGGTRQAPLQKLSGRHHRGAQLIAQGARYQQVSAEVGFAPDYWSRLATQSPLFQACIKQYRQQEEAAWQASRSAHFGAIDDELTALFWRKLARRKRHMSTNEALIRGAAQLLRASEDALEPIAAARRRRGEQAPIEVGNTAQQELEAQFAAVEAKLTAARRRQQPVVRSDNPATHSLPLVQPQQRVQDQAGLSGRRRLWR